MALFGEGVKTLGRASQEGVRHWGMAFPFHASCPHDAKSQPLFPHSFTSPQTQSHRASLPGMETPETMNLSSCCFSSMFVKTGSPTTIYFHIAGPHSRVSHLPLWYQNRPCDLISQEVWRVSHPNGLRESLRRVLVALSHLHREICPQRILASYAWNREDIAQCWIMDM